MPGRQLRYTGRTEKPALVSFSYLLMAAQGGGTRQPSMRQTDGLPEHGAGCIAVTCFPGSNSILVNSISASPRPPRRPSYPPPVGLRLSFEGDAVAVFLEALYDAQLCTSCEKRPLLG